MAQLAFPSDLVLRGGRIWTGNPAQPEAQSVLCRDGRIFAVGTTAQIDAISAPGAQIIALNGRRAVPGFNDAHVHFLDGGRNLASVQLRDAATPQEFRRRLAAFAASHPKGRWITGGDWDHENFPSAGLPTRQLIDDVTPDHPVFVQRLDGHMALVNSLVLRLAGITRETPDPPGGVIVRDASGHPTGILKDAAMDAVHRVIPPLSAAEIEDGLRAAMRHANAHGVTSVHDMSASPDVLRVYQKLLREQALTVRVYGLQPLRLWQRLAAPGLQAGFGNDMLRIGGLKGFADGSLGSTTAWFFDSYNDAPGNTGLPSDEILPPGKLPQNILDADAAGLQLAIHAIGDRANHQVLSLFEDAIRRNGPSPRRFRIEHAQHLRPRDIPRFASAQVVASMQPYHAIDDGRWADKRIGPTRAQGTYAFRSLLDAGVTLAFGSDWFVAPIHPLMGIYAAATRRTLDGKRPGGWVPEQKITVAEALRAFTYGSAFASHEEKTKGVIAPGFAADFAVLSDDILSISPDKIDTVRTDITILAGRVVYSR